jgi:peptidoglycan/xylan/chitin deacetylase (PgdA/CDA1 family)
MTEIWFDDGLLSVYESIFPIMKSFGLTGIIGVVTSNVGGQFKWYISDHYGGHYVEMPCMTIEQIKELLKSGWQVASHTVTHRDLTMIPLEEAKQEIIESKKWIEENLGITPTIFIAPWNHITSELKEFALQYYSRVIADKNRIEYHGSEYYAGHMYYKGQKFECDNYYKSLLSGLKQ